MPKYEYLVAVHDNGIWELKGASTELVPEIGASPLTVCNQLGGQGWRFVRSVPLNPYASEWWFERQSD
jgi:hypothetical protein